MVSDMWIQAESDDAEPEYINLGQVACVSFGDTNITGRAGVLRTAFIGMANGERHEVYGGPAVVLESLLRASAASFKRG